MLSVATQHPGVGPMTTAAWEGVIRARAIVLDEMIARRHLASATDDAETPGWRPNWGLPASGSPPPSFVAFETILLNGIAASWTGLAVTRSAPSAIWRRGVRDFARIGREAALAFANCRPRCRMRVP